MIKFFSKIRQRLLSENKFSKYLTYAIGEILLVVIGILIALQINNWNESRKEYLKLKVYLENMKNDLTNDIARMEDIHDINMFRFYSLQYILRLAEKKELDIGLAGTTVPPWKQGNHIWSGDLPQNYDKEFLRLAFLWSHRNSFKAVTKTTINELKSTGLFSYIRDNNLKKAINDYYILSDFRINESIQANQSIIEDWHKSLTEEGIVNADPFLVGDPVTLIRDNKQREGILRRLIRGAGWLVEGGPLIAREAELLIERIDETLSQ